MAGSITSVNAVLMLTVPGVYSTPQQLQNFSADDIYDFDQQAVAQTEMGVDGQLAGGLVFTEKKQKIYLMADSASILIFEGWKQAQDTLRDVYIATMTTTLTSVSRKYTQSGGFLTMYSPAPNAKRVLQQRVFEITWESVVAAPTSATAF